MPFRVKDILIDVVQPAPCPQHTLVFCHLFCTRIPSLCHIGCTVITCHWHHSIIPCGIQCSFQWSGCGFHTLQCPGGTLPCGGGTIACPGSVVDPGVLDPGVIRERMKAELAAAQAQEEAMAEAMRPQTIEQVELLETKLNEALAELKRRRDELKKK